MTRHCRALGSVVGLLVCFLASSCTGSTTVAAPTTTLCQRSAGAKVGYPAPYAPGYFTFTGGTLHVGVTEKAPQGDFFGIEVGDPVLVGVRFYDSGSDPLKSASKWSVLVPDGGWETIQLPAGQYPVSTSGALLELAGCQPGDVSYVVQSTAQKTW